MFKIGFIIIYVTHKNRKEAKKIVDALLKEKLIACANVFPIMSRYCWKDEIKCEEEIVTLLKTSAEKWEKVKEMIKKIHPYEVPCIIKIPIKANKKYEDWINSETKNN